MKAKDLQPIRLAGEVALDFSILQDSKALITCNSGAGKSWQLRSMIEQVCDQGQSFVIDKEGEFKTLRERHDFVLVGGDGELPADPQTARALASALAKGGANAILDLSDIEPDAQCRFVAEFCDGLFYLPKSEWSSRFVFVDEAQEFAPQTDVSLAQLESLRSIVRVAAMGRKRGLCLIAASQRIAKVSKNVTAECNNRMIGRFAEDADLKRGADLLGFSKARWRDLQTAKPGQFWAYGPAFNFDGVQLVHAGDVHTTHPKRGARHLLKTPAPSSAIAKVVAELRALQAAPPAPATGPTPLPSDRSDDLCEAYDQGVAFGTAAAREVCDELRSKAGVLVAAALNRLQEIEAFFGTDPFGEGYRPRPLTARPSERVSSVSSLAPPSPVPDADDVVWPPTGEGATVLSPATRKKGAVLRLPEDYIAGRVPLGDRAEDRILRALLMFDGASTRRKVAALARMPLGGSTMRGALARLREAGMIVDVDESTLDASPATRRVFAGKVPPLPRGRALIEHWKAHLGVTNAAGRLFAVIATEPRRRWSQPELSAVTGMPAGGSTMRGGLAELRKLDLLDSGGAKVSLRSEML